MIRQIIHIDEEKCNGCGACASACHEGAIDMVDGKAKLMREHFCDGFGDCLPNCPTGAITFENREAPEYDQAAVEQAQKEQKEQKMQNGQQEAARQTAAQQTTAQQKTVQQTFTGGEKTMKHTGCPGSAMMNLRTQQENQENAQFTADGLRKGPQTIQPAAGDVSGSGKPVSRLQQWPVQIKLLPTEAPFYDGAKLLIAADCTAYAYANMHEEFMKGKVTMIGCPKLDAVDYTEKLTEIIKNNNIKSVTIVRMEVPCCGGLQRAAEQALKNSGKFLPWQVVTITRDGKIKED